MKKGAVFLLFLTLTLSSHPVAFAEDTLPQEAAQALMVYDYATLYSLEPKPGIDAWVDSIMPWDHVNGQGERFHGYLILGKTELKADQAQAAIAAFKDGITAGKGSALCTFSPRRALRLTANGHTYDFLACYRCGQLEVFDGDKNIALLSIGGTPDVLNGLLNAANIPLSSTGN